MAAVSHKFGAGFKAGKDVELNIRWIIRLLEHYTRQQMSSPISLNLLIRK